MNPYVRSTRQGQATVVPSGIAGSGRKDCGNGGAGRGQAKAAANTVRDFTRPLMPLQVTRQGIRDTEARDLSPRCRWA
jgi:hypothetical protein